MLIKRMNFRARGSEEPTGLSQKELIRKKNKDN